MIVRGNVARVSNLEADRRGKPLLSITVMRPRQFGVTQYVVNFSGDLAQEVFEAVQVTDQVIVEMDEATIKPEKQVDSTGREILVISGFGKNVGFTISPQK